MAGFAASVFSALSPDKKCDPVPASVSAAAPTLFFSKPTFSKRTKVNIRIAAKLLIVYDKIIFKLGWEK
jgi:hypothetical protein